MMTSKPENTKILIESSFRGDTVFKLPSAGWNTMTIFYLFFAVIWNSFNFRVLLSPTTPSIFSYVFFPIGAFPFFAFLYSFFMHADVVIGDGRLSVSRILFGLRISKSCALLDVESIKQGVAYKRNYQPVYGIQVIYKPSGKMIFGSNLRNDEREWLIGEMNSARAQS